MAWKQKEGFDLVERKWYSIADNILSILSVFGRVLVAFAVLNWIANNIYASDITWIVLMLAILSYAFYPFISDVMSRFRFKYVRK
ncbi:hypothetical protein LCGC14_1849920 [marine sediment metagenome]|uniref:Uncharacterized protein n=1 Tax=marine sediment metagenome TaxID=412755 RepID=A0A0F9GAX6_9ZZZZ